MPFQLPQPMAGVDRPTLGAMRSPLEDFQSDWAEAIANYESHRKYARTYGMESKPGWTKEELDAEYFAPLRAKWGIESRAEPSPWQVVHTDRGGIYRVNSRTGDKEVINEPVPIKEPSKLTDAQHMEFSMLEKDLEELRKGYNKMTEGGKKPGDPELVKVADSIDRIKTRMERIIGGLGASPVQADSGMFSPRPISAPSPSATPGVPLMLDQQFLPKPAQSSAQPMSIPTPAAFQQKDWTATVVQPNGDTEVWTPTSRMIKPGKKAQAAPAATAETKSEYATPEEVKAAYKAGDLTREEAAAILSEQFGM